MLLSGVLVEPRVGKCFEDRRVELSGQSWEDVMFEIQNGTLPRGWKRDAEMKVRQLKMLPTETFVDYVDRAQSLYAPVEGHSKITLSDLAEYMYRGRWTPSFYYVRICTHAYPYIIHIALY